MIQIFILGSSSVYGVGASEVGWADLVKRALHQKMYGKNGIGEKIEVFNFGKSGATIDWVLRTFPQQLEQYGRGSNIITIVSVGGNNSKAKDQPNNFVSSLDEYQHDMTKLLDLLLAKSDQVVFVGSGSVDEHKTNPKLNPLTGGKSYFTNARRMEFQTCCKQLCQEKGIPFIDLEIGEAEWQQNYLFKDGLHPNQHGHTLIAEKVLKVVEQWL